MLVNRLSVPLDDPHVEDEAVVYSEAITYDVDKGAHIVVSIPPYGLAAFRFPSSVEGERALVNPRFAEFLLKTCGLDEGT